MAGIASNVGQGVQLGAAKRVLGVGQLGLNAADALANALGMDRTKLLSMKEDLAGAQQEANTEGAASGAGEGVGEFMGDPLTYAAGGVGGAALKVGSKLEKALALAKASGIVGAVGGATTGQTDKNSGVMDNLVNSLVGGGEGVLTALALPGAAGVAKGGLNAVKGLVNRAAASVGSTSAATRIGIQLLAKRLMADGISPEQLVQHLKDAGAVDLGQTLGEATGSPGVLQAEKNIVRGTGEGAKNMRDALIKRNTETIPNTISAKANQLVDEGNKAGSFYKKAADEANAQDQVVSSNDVPSTSPTMQHIDDGMYTGPIDTVETKTPVFENLKETVGNIGSEINNRLAQLGNVKNLEQATLSRAKDILDNSAARGHSFESVLDAKKQLDNIYIDNPDHGIQRKAAGYVADYAGQLSNELNNLAPDNYSQATGYAQQGMAGRDLNYAVDNTKEGLLKTLHDKVFGTPAKQEDFLRKIPMDQQQQYVDLFSQLKKVSGGFGGSDTSFNTPAGESLNSDIVGFNPSDLNPTKFLPNVASKVGDMFNQPVRKAIINTSLNSPEDVIPALIKRNQTVLDAPLVQRGTPVAAAVTADSLVPRDTQTATPAPDDDPYAKLVPKNQTTDPYAALIPRH